MRLTRGRSSGPFFEVAKWPVASQQPPVLGVPWGTYLLAYMNLNLTDGDLEGALGFGVPDASVSVSLEKLREARLASVPVKVFALEGFPVTNST